MKKNYRGATVEDLDPPPALSILPSMPLGDALNLSFEHSFSYLPVLDNNKRLLGYLTADQLERSSASQRSDLVSSHYLRFSKSGRYIPITPDTPLEKLEEFFESGNQFAIITDEHRKFVLGVATPDDLQKYLRSRPDLA